MISREEIKYSLNGNKEKKIVEIDSIDFIKEKIQDFFEENHYSAKEIREIKDDLNDIFEEVSEEVFEIDFDEVLENDEKFLSNFVEEVSEFISKNY